MGEAVDIPRYFGMTVIDPGSEIGVVVSVLARALGVQRLVLLQRRGLTRMWRVACLLDSGDVIWRKRLQLFMFDSRTITKECVCNSCAVR